MGNSSTPGTHTITNCPGSASSLPSNRIVFVPGVSFLCCLTSNISRPVRVGHPQHLLDRSVAVGFHEGRHLLACLREYVDPSRPDRSTDLDSARAGHDVLDRVSSS